MRTSTVHTLVGEARRPPARLSFLFPVLSFWKVLDDGGKAYSLLDKSEETQALES